jgi:hypothetical protein
VYQALNYPLIDLCICKYLHFVIHAFFITVFLFFQDLIQKCVTWLQFRISTKGKEQIHCEIYSPSNSRCFRYGWKGMWTYRKRLQDADGGWLYQKTHKIFIHLVVCLTKRPSHFQSELSTWCDLEYPLLSLSLSSSFLCLLPLLSFTSIPPFILPSITWCRRQFLRKKWPIQFAFRFLISCRIFLCSLTLHFAHDRSSWFSPSSSRTTYKIYVCPMALLICY